MKRFYSLTFLVGLWLTGINCQSTVGQNEAVLAPEAFATKLKKTTQAQVLDVRTPEEFAEKHLTNATNINYHNPDFSELAGKALDKKKPVFVYCLAGGRSAKARQILQAQGYEVYEMQGGLAKWQNAGLPLDFQPNAAGKKGMSISDFEKNLVKGKLTLVDFSATWCLPCKKLKPVLEKVGKDMENTIALQIHDFDENPDLASQYSIDALPTLLLFKEGKIVWRFVGVLEEDALKKELTKYL